MAEQQETAVASYIAPTDEKAQNTDETGVASLTQTGKGRWARLMPVIACGAGLFSDGYVQSVIGPVNTCLKNLYGTAYTGHWEQDVTSIAFAGTVVGQLVFGYTSDHYSRKWSLLVSTVILFIFAALCAGAWGAGGTLSGLFAALTAYRFLLGIGIGGEYPAGSVGCAEATGELEEGTRNRWFILFTNVQIDIGYVLGTLVPMIVAAITTDLTVVWRVSLGIAVIPPLSLIYFRWKLKEPESVTSQSFRKAPTPYWLALKFYGPRLAVVAMIWFIYDFLTYPFSIYSSVWISEIDPNPSLWQTFGWSTLVNAFYIPGALLGAYTSDWMGPKLALSVFVAAQGIVGFIMSGCYAYLKEPKNVAGFVVVYGIFLMLGEMGPGDNIGLIASKTSATGIRGQYYAIAAACGKIGAFVGSYVFPVIENDGGGVTTVRGGQYPFYVASSLALFAAAIVWLLPKIEQDTIGQEDVRFRAYLEAHGWDTTQMGGGKSYASAQDLSDENEQEVSGKQISEQPQDLSEKQQYEQPASQ